MTFNHTPEGQATTARPPRRWLTRTVLVAILLVGAYLRFLSLFTWDEPSFRLHPDERFLTDVASTLQLPASFSEYLDSERNPLNPRNYSKSTWYVYGLLPQTLTQYTAVMLTPDEALPRCIDRPNVPDPSLPIGRPCGDPTVDNYQNKIANNDLGVPKLTPLMPLLNPDGVNMTEFYQIFKVGRAWSALFDLGAVLLAFLIARRLYGWRAGLLAAALLAFSVLPIQLAHFFTVDAATGFFVLLAIYWAVRCSQGGGWGSFVALGLSIGGAMACRVTLATLGLTGMFAVGARLWLEWQALRGQPEAPPSLLDLAARRWRLLAMLAVAGLLALLSFRVLQPDAFRGSSFFDLRPEPRFVENIQRIGLYVSGEADSPPNQQWTGRIPFLFPLQNMVLWGFGLPLGIAALAGWVAAGWQLLRRGKLVHLIPWGWVSFYFLWQGGQFVTTMRYYSSMYGLLAALAAWALVALYDMGHADFMRRRRRGLGGVSLQRLAGIGALVAVVLGTAMWAYAFTRIYTQPHSRIAASRWIYQNIPSGSAITSEEWDDGLPLNLDGRSSSQYIGLQTKPYAEDEPSKYFGQIDLNGTSQLGLLDQLDQADYLIYSSNRVYDSTKRLPMRYPALTRYYNALFEGKLGFELVADLHSYPTLFGIEIPTPVLAEEAFSVYDHPRVLIFKKTPEYSRAQAEALITDGVAWGEVYKISSFVAGKVPTALRLTGDQWQAFRDGGTSILPSLVGSLAPWLAWLVVLELLGMAAFVLLFRVLPGLPDRGFALSKPLGLLLVGWLAWLLASLGAGDGKPLLSFSPLSVWLCALVLIVPAGVLGWRWRAELGAFWRARRTALLTAEGLFLLVFFGFLVLRALNPDLWHDARGGEKPMDLAFLTATLRSTAFPPYDPWFAGGYINYYYFGFVLVGTLVHLTGTAPTVAYNLAVPTIAALTAIGAFGVSFNLLARRYVAGAAEPANAAPRQWRALGAGVAAAVFVVLLGPLTQALWFLPGTADPNDLGIPAECRIVASYAAQQSCRGRNEWAFWDATRAVGMAISKQTGGNDSTITEFPFFTFLFGDLHAHMIALPLALLALGWMVAALRSHGLRRQRWQLGISLGGMALAVGALAATNTWDYPTYLGLSVLALGLLGWRHWRNGAPLFGVLWRWLLGAVLLVVLARLLFLPFHQHFATDYAGFTLWSGERTPAAEFLKINGLWLFLALAGGMSYYRRKRSASIVVLAGVGVGMLLLCLVFALTGASALYLLIPLLGLAVGALLDILFHTPPPGEAAPNWGALFPVLLGCAALGLCFVPEVLVAKGDIGRMNTVFKIGMQSWTLFGVLGGVAFASLWTNPARRGVFSSLSLGGVVLGAGASLLILAALVYPLTATPARLADRFDTQIAPTLDGTAYMASPKAHWGENGSDFTFAEDADALDWMRRNIPGTPVVLEAQSEGYRWAGRVSIYTGLPTVLGWPWHETQQRSAAQVQPILDSRRNLVQQLYTGADDGAVLAALHQYGIEYIYAGQLERALYGTVGLDTFERMATAGQLERVYEAGQTRIYHVAGEAQNPPAIVTTSLAVVAPALPAQKTLLLDRPVGMLDAVNEYAWNGLAESQPVAVLLWLLCWLALGVLGFPITALLFGRWRDGGVAFAPLAGLLLLGYAVWLPVSARLWAYNRWSLLLGLLLVLALNAAVLLWQGRTSAGVAAKFAAGAAWLREHLRVHRRPATVVLVVASLGFVAMAVIRALNPDLWQPSWGGEKPFEFGFLNAILRSPVMPPYSPFYSDGTINYYYYGLFLVSLPIKATGIAPAVGFNLALASLFALTLSAAFVLGWQLTERVRYGVVGAAFVLLLGNLAAVFPTEGGWSAGLAPVLSALTNGSASFGQQLDAWFVGPSRVIPYTINEFPFWTFLFSDLHPHLIALPITLLAIAAALTLADARLRGGWAMLLGFAGFVLGTLAITNSWDFPTYALLLVAAAVGGVWLDQRWNGAALVGRLLGALAAAGGAAGLGLLLYLPFFQNFQAMVGGIGFTHTSTPVADYAVIYGVFLAVLLPGLIGALVLAGRRVAQANPPAVPDGALGIVARRSRVPGLPLLAAGVLLLALLAALVLPQSGLPLKLLLVAGMLGVLALLVRRWLSPLLWFALLLAGLGFAISLGIEYIFIRDHLAGGDWYRMNTVFKFGMQVWVLLALAAAAVLPWLVRATRRISVVLEIAAVAVLAVLAILALIFPLVGTASRVAYRFPVSPGPTLDGLAFMDSAVYSWQEHTISLRDDGEAIRWLNENIEGTPVVLQSSMEFYRAYGVRVAANTGLPTVVSPLHESEQRDPDAVSSRDLDVINFYRTLDPNEALRILSKYRVGYVYVGPIERAAYGEGGMAKYAQLVGQYLVPVFQNGSAAIYQVNENTYSLPTSDSGTTVITIQPQPQNPVTNDNTNTNTPAPAPADPAGQPTLAELEQQQQADPQDAGPAFGLGQRYRDMGRYDDAIAVLATAAAANPTDVALHHLLGDTLRDAGQVDEAIQAYSEAAQAQPTGGNYNKLGTELLNFGRFEQAEIALNEALRLDANVTEPYFRLGELYERQQDTTRALEYYQRYLERDPNGLFSEQARAAVARLGS